MLVFTLFGPLRMWSTGAVPHYVVAITNLLINPRPAVAFGPHLEGAGHK
ncbi:unnamed protein product [Ectocarpus sp. 12 AP-2014]